MASGSGTSFNQPYNTQNGGILPIPNPSSTGGNTYFYESVGGTMLKGGVRPIRQRKKTNDKKTPKFYKKTKKPSTKKRLNTKKPDTTKKSTKSKPVNKDKCRICKLKIF